MQGVAGSIPARSTVINCKETAMQLNQIADDGQELYTIIRAAIEQFVANDDVGDYNDLDRDALVRFTAAVTQSR